MISKTKLIERKKTVKREQRWNWVKSKCHGKRGNMCISHLEYILWPVTCDSQEWLVSNVCCKSRRYYNMHGHQSLQLDARLALCDYCTKSNGPAETFAIYQGICTTKLCRFWWKFVKWFYLNKFYLILIKMKKWTGFRRNVCREGCAINTHNEAHICTYSILCMCDLMRWRVENDSNLPKKKTTNFQTKNWRNLKE